MQRSEWKKDYDKRGSEIARLDEMVRQAEKKCTRTIQSAAICMQQTREEARDEIEGMRSELQAVQSAHAGAQGQIGDATARLQVSPGKGNRTAARSCPTMLCEHLQQLGAEGPSRLLQQPDAVMSPTVAGKGFIAQHCSTVAQTPQLVVMTPKHVKGQSLGLQTMRSRLSRSSTVLTRLPLPSSRHRLHQAAVGCRGAIASPSALAALRAARRGRPQHLAGMRPAGFHDIICSWWPPLLDTARLLGLPRSPCW